MATPEYTTSENVVEVHKENSASDEESIQWQRKLWVKQDNFPDNYVDHSFLEGLERNVNVQAPDFSKLVLESLPIVQQLSNVTIFICCFVALYHSRISASTISALSILAAGLGSIYWTITEPMKADRSSFHAFLSSVKSGLIIGILLFAISPILKSLTISTTSDSIWALATYLFLANLALHDYYGSSSSNIRFRGSLSTNAAIMASVVLASRLSHTKEVYSLTLFAIDCFALFPTLRKRVQTNSLHLQIYLTTLLVFSASMLLSLIASVGLTLIFIGAILFISFACPLLLISLQKYKNEIRGPWDMARPRVRKRTYSTHMNNPI